MYSDESIDLPLANGSQNRFTARGASRSLAPMVSGSIYRSQMALRIDFSLGGTTGAPRGHIVHTSAVTPCGHTVWTLFLPLLEPYSETLLGNYIHFD